VTAATVSPIQKDSKPKKKASVAAREAEAGDGFVTVEQCGITLRIPVGGKVPLTAYIAFTEGKNLEGTKLLLGDEQWNAFLEKNPTLDDFEAIGDRLQESAGN
jgi:hypothetical protein